jgi:hypothetical protein
MSDAQGEGVAPEQQAQAERERQLREDALAKALTPEQKFRQYLALDRARRDRSARA